LSPSGFWALVNSPQEGSVTLVNGEGESLPCDIDGPILMEAAVERVNHCKQLTVHGAILFAGSLKHAAFQSIGDPWNAPSYPSSSEEANQPSRLLPSNATRNQ
jgi:hypothetical protein